MIAREVALLARDLLLWAVRSRAAGAAGGVRM